MKQSSVESGFLSVFRLFVGIRLFFGVLFSVLAIVLPVPNGVHTPFAGWISNVEALLLLIYLSWPWLQNQLGRLYIPLALGWAILLPIFENFLVSNVQATTGDVRLIQTFAGQWQLIILLFVPLILISWRYSFRTVVYSILSMLAIDLILALYEQFHGGGHFWIPISVAAFRTLFYLLVGYVINRLSYELRAQNLRLEVANRQLATHAETLEKLAVSRERNRVAREMHDTLAHSLSAVAVQLEAVNALWTQDPQQAHMMLNASLKLTRSGLNDARRAISALRTAPLEDMGLGLALTNLAYAQAERGGFHLDVQVPTEVPSLNPQLEHSLYRIAEEALHNIVEHAEARNVVVQFHKDPPLKGKQGKDCWSLIIRDDGRGFIDNTVKENNHFGLRGMRERVEEFGGTLSIQSTPPAGTEVEVKFEVRHDSGVDL